MVLAQQGKLSSI